MKMICPHCGLKGTAEETLLGKKVRCPECQQVFRVDEKVIVTEAFRDAGDDVEQSVVTQTLSNTSEELESSQEPEETPVLAEGVAFCQKCGFASSERFMVEGSDEPICVICAG